MPSEKKTKVGRLGWSEEESQLLSEEIESAIAQGKPLKMVFDRVAKKTGRKPNSIRNYYYTSFKVQKGGQRLRPPFDIFTEEEILHLLESVLEAQAKGISVRKCTMQMAGGDKSAMLRYQNKYRSLLKNRPDLVRRVAAQMKREGRPVIDPLARYKPLPSLSPAILQDEAQARQVAKNMWRSTFSTLEGMPTSQMLAMVQSVTSLVYAVDAGRSQRQQSEQRSEWAEQLRILSWQIEKLQQENRGLIRQLEMVHMPFDGDAHARSAEPDPAAISLASQMQAPDARKKPDQPGMRTISDYNKQRQSNMINFSNEITE
ncbi:MAG: hypothetical protein ACOX88_08490 [Christensenellales bacterium]|jgi:hypothetical protein